MSLQAGFLLSIAGLGVTLAGFSGLVAAFRRGASLKPMDAYRLRQIPEMGLAVTVIALVTIPLSDTVRPHAAIQIASGAALLFTVWHILNLNMRLRRLKLRQNTAGLTAAGLIDILVLIVGAASLAVGSTVAYEWVLVLLLARPTLAFVLVLSDVGAG